jgi:hypothetical protein
MNVRDDEGNNADVSDCKIAHIESQDSHCFSGNDDNTGW